MVSNQLTLPHDVPSYLGAGLYTPREAAHFARINTRMMTRWIHGSVNRESVVRAELGALDEQKVVTFLDFIQSLAIRQLRRQRPQPSLQKIREAYEEAATRYKVEHPFGYTHECFYDGKAIWIKLPWLTADDEADDTLFTKVTGKQKGQSAFREIAQIYRNRITFAEDNKVATAFTLYQDELGTIVMDPQKRFGEPLLASGYSLQTILDAYAVETDVGAVSRMYEITEEEVILAVRCDDYLDVRAAA